MMFKSPMWITPLPPSLTALGKVHMAQFSMEIMRLPAQFCVEINTQPSMRSDHAPASARSASRAAFSTTSRPPLARISAHMVRAA